MIGPVDRLYRYEGQVYETETVIRREMFRVVKTTYAGWWVANYGKPRFILRGAGKRWAYPNPRDAFYSFLKRKRMQVSILATQHDKAQALLTLAEKKWADEDFSDLYARKKSSLVEIFTPGFGSAV